MKDLEDLMHSFGLDPSNPDDLDELIYRIGMHNDNPSIYNPDALSEQLSDYMQIDDVDANEPDLQDKPQQNPKDYSED